MEELLKKEIEKIKIPLIAHIQAVLEDDFKTTSGREIRNIIRIQIGEILVDSENSDFNGDIVINRIEIVANANCLLNEGAYRREDLVIRPTNTIYLKYDHPSGLYSIMNADKFDLMDFSND
jgi:hypothetical protein